MTLILRREDLGQRVRASQKTGLGLGLFVPGVSVLDLIPSSSSLSFMYMTMHATVLVGARDLRSVLKGFVENF